MNSNRFNTTLISVFFLFVFLSCTRQPFDPDNPAALNRDGFIFTQLLPAMTIRALSVAGNTAGVLCVAVMDDGGEITIITNESGQWEELGRITASTSSSRPLLDIAPDSGGFWFVLVSDDVNGVVLHRTDGSTDTEQSIPWFGESPWNDEYGTIQTTGAGDISAILPEITRGPVLCVRTGETWTFHEPPGTTVSAQIFSYRTDSAGLHHILYQTSTTAPSEYVRFSAEGWVAPLEVGNGQEGSDAGAPLKLSISNAARLRVIGFDLSRDLLVIWAFSQEEAWDPEALPISEDVLIRDHLSVTTDPDGVPYLAVARFNGMSRYDLLWYSYRASRWEVAAVAGGLHRLGSINPVRMTEAGMAGAVPHLVFAEFDSDGELARLWDAEVR